MLKQQLLKPTLFSADRAWREPSDGNCLAHHVSVPRNAAPAAELTAAFGG